MDSIQLKTIRLRALPVLYFFGFTKILCKYVPKYLFSHIESKSPELKAKVGEGFESIIILESLEGWKLKVLALFREIEVHSFEVIEVRIKLWIFPLVIIGLISVIVLLRGLWRGIVVFCTFLVIGKNSVSFRKFGKLFLSSLNVIDIFILNQEKVTGWWIRASFL